MGCLTQGESPIGYHLLSMEFEKRMIQVFQKRDSTVVSFRLALTLRCGPKSAYAKLAKTPQCSMSL